MYLKDLLDNKNNWKLIPKVSGIYAIHNKITDGVYIGSAINLKSRLKDHSKCLRYNKHKNPHLQNSFNKHGIESFSFQILELCEPKDLIKFEQAWLDLKFGNNCYNICPTAGSPLNRKMPQSFIDNLSCTFKVIYPDGKVEIQKNLNEFCKINNLDISTAHRVLRGKQHKHKGFRFYPINDIELAKALEKESCLNKELIYKRAKIIDPNGNIVYLQPSKIREFELANNMNKASLSSVCNQAYYYCTYKGWTGYYCDEEGIILPEIALNQLKAINNKFKEIVYKELDSILYEITTLDNIKIYTRNLKLFCNLYDCNYSTILGCLKKRYNTFNNGWTIKVDE